MSRGGIVVVGAGWSGLAAATRLVEAGLEVTLVEAAHHVGGRARALDIAGDRLDNGQHLLLGGYRATLAAMRRVGIAPESVLQRAPLAFEMIERDRVFRFRVGAGPAMPALALALLRAHGIRPRERLRALAGAHGLRRAPSPDRSVATWLADLGQPSALVRCLWEPLCLAALNTRVHEASARLFAETLAETFRTPRARDLMLPRQDLGGLWPDPALGWLRAHAAPIRLGTRVRALRRDADCWRLHTREGALTATQVVLAVPTEAAADMLPGEDPAARRIIVNMRQLGSRPITTIWLRDRNDTHSRGRIADHPLMVGRLDGPAQWVFDRRVTNQPGIRAAVISGDGPHMSIDRTELGAQVARQLATATGRPEVLATIREKRATFAATPDCETLRPPIDGPWPDLWLAGDSVANGLPATIEGAVRNGHRAADRLMERLEMRA